jgi:hypothetical protein
MAPIQESIEWFSPRKNEECADATLCQRETQGAELVEHVTTGSRCRVSDDPERDALEEAAKIVLKNHDEDQGGHGK